MKIAFFDTQAYDREFFDHANIDFNFEIEYHVCRLSGETAWMAKGASAVCVSVHDCVDEVTLAVLKDLEVKTIALRCSGFDNVNVEKAKELKIKVIRVASYSPHSIAEHAVGLILSLCRKIHLADDRVHHGNYSLEGLLGFELRGKTVGILGTGAIGSAFAQIMHGFGCKLVAYDQKPDAGLEAKFKVRYLTLNEVLAQSDILSLHLPLNNLTRKILNADCLERLKPGCLFVNTGRGALVDSAALVKGLKSGRLGYCGLDVYEKEATIFTGKISGAVQQDDVFARLQSFQNVLITPHLAFFTKEALTEIAVKTLTQLKG